MRATPSFLRPELIFNQLFDDIYLMQTRKRIGASIYMIGGLHTLVLGTLAVLTDLATAVWQITAKPFDAAFTHAHIDHVESIHEFDHIRIHSSDRGIC
jgi:hypothetical protein